VEKSSSFGVIKELMGPQGMLQLSSQAISQGATIRPHGHIAKNVQLIELKAQKPWVFISGCVKETSYDLYNNIVSDSVELAAGDLSSSLADGYWHEILEETRYWSSKLDFALGKLLTKFSPQAESKVL
jgi:hypothetical protein